MVETSDDDFEREQIKKDDAEAERLALIADVEKLLAPKNYGPVRPVLWIDAIVEQARHCRAAPEPTNFPEDNKADNVG